MNKELETNTNLSHYRIVAKIGAGGMGEVYLVEQNELTHQMAVISGVAEARRIHAVSSQITAHLTMACTRPRRALLSSARRRA